MPRRLATIGAILRKDLLMTWPLTAFAVVMPLAQPWYAPMTDALHGIPPALIAGLVSVLLIFVLVQNDAPASTRHDWLTRPIRRADMLIAKAVLLLLTLYLPWLGGHLADMAINNHYPAGEIALAGSGELLFALGLLPLLALACVTANKIEAFVALICIPVAAVLLGWAAGFSPPAHAIIGFGQNWILTWVELVLFAAACGVVLWLQYGRRQTWAARAVIVATFVGTVAFSLIPSEWALAQTTPQTASTLTVGNARLCEISKAVAFAEPKPRARVYRWPEEVRRAAGGDARAIWVDSRIAGLPEGWTVVVDRLDGRYGQGALATAAWGGGFQTRAAQRLSLPGVPPRQALGADALESTWLIPAATKGADGPFHLTVQFSLMKPVRTYRLAQDGARHQVPGLGYCGAKPMTSAVDTARSQVNCVNVWPIPAQLFIRAAGPTGNCMIDCTSGGPVYNPVWAQLPTTRRYTVSGLAVAPSQDILVTTYERVGQVTRQVDLSGPIAACAPPPPPPAEHGAA